MPVRWRPLTSARLEKSPSRLTSTFGMVQGCTSLSAAQVRAPQPRLLSDGGNPLLNEKPTLSREWTFITKARGRWREKGLVSSFRLSVADARPAATRVPMSIDDGADPFTSKNEKANGAPEFRCAGEQFVVSMVHLRPRRRREVTAR